MHTHTHIYIYIFLYTFTHTHTHTHTLSLSLSLLFSTSSSLPSLRAASPFLPDFLLSSLPFLFCLCSHLRKLVMKYMRCWHCVTQATRIVIGKYRIWRRSCWCGLLCAQLCLAEVDKIACALCKGPHVQLGWLGCVADVAFLNFFADLELLLSSLLLFFLKINVRFTFMCVCVFMFACFYCVCVFIVCMCVFLVIYFVWGCACMCKAHFFFTPQSQTWERRSFIMAVFFWSSWEIMSIVFLNSAFSLRLLLKWKQKQVWKNT